MTMARLPAALNRSLSLRLLVFAGGAIALALATAWLVLGLLFERHLERQVQTELERHGIALIAALHTDGQGRPTLTKEPVDPRFSRPASGLYWRIKAPGGELRSRSLWDGASPAPPRRAATGWSTFTAQGPYEPQTLIAARYVRLDPGTPDILIEVAADRAPISAASAAFGQETAIFLAVLWCTLAAASWVQVYLGLQPLKRIGEQLENMAQAPEARLDQEDHPLEIRPLSSAINNFADRRADDVERARQRARDLAHALKTPLTALRLQIETLPPETARDMGYSLALLSGAVEGELARTGAAPSAQKTAIAPLIDRLIAVIARTPDGTRLALHNTVPAQLSLPLSTEASLEALGALIENAARHARAQVMIGGGESEHGRWITIADDGPGIPEPLHAAALGRGVRLDERGARHGLGLSIARDFVEASGGTLTLSAAPQGGLCVKLDWHQ